MASGLTPTYSLPYPQQTDPVDVASDVNALASAVEVVLLAKSPLASPVFTGIPVSTTAAVDTSTTQIATTKFVVDQGYLKTATATSTYAPLASPSFTGNPTATTQSLGNNSTRLATTAYVQTELGNFVTLPSQSGATGKFLKSDGTAASWNMIAISDVSTLSTVISDLPSTYAPLNIAVETKVSGYTLVVTDASKQIEMNSASANTLLIPTDATAAFPKGTTIVVVQLGVGQTTISAATPATTTIRYTPGNKLRTQYSVATLIKRATNDWIISGDLIA